MSDSEFVRFEQLHRGATPLLLANAWDAGSARILEQLGVARVSVGGAFAFAAYGALVRAAGELRDRGTHEYLELTAVGAQAARAAFAGS